MCGRSSHLLRGCELHARLILWPSLPKEQPKAKEQKTKQELQAMARERLGCAVPVRRDGNSGWYFQIIEVAGLNSGTLQRRANLLAEELRQLYDLKE